MLLSPPPVADPANPPSDVQEILRRQQRLRVIRFAVCELIALALFVLSVAAGLSERFAADSFTPFFHAAPIGAATLAAFIPILFFGHPARRLRTRRRTAAASSVATARREPA